MADANIAADPRWTPAKMLVPTATSTTAAFSAFQSSGLDVLSHAPDRTLRQYPGTDMFRAGSLSSCGMVTADCAYRNARSDRPTCLHSWQDLTILTFNG